MSSAPHIFHDKIRLGGIKKQTLEIFQEKYVTSFFNLCTSFYFISLVLTETHLFHLSN